MGGNNSQNRQEYAGAVPIVSMAGNIRELQNIVERSVILCGGDNFFGSKRLGSPAMRQLGKSCQVLCKTLSRIRREKLLKRP